MAIDLKKNIIFHTRQGTSGKFFNSSNCVISFQTLVIKINEDVTYIKKHTYIVLTTTCRWAMKIIYSILIEIWVWHQMLYCISYYTVTLQPSCKKNIKIFKLAVKFKLLFAHKLFWYCCLRFLSGILISFSLISMLILLKA